MNEKIIWSYMHIRQRLIKKLKKDQFSKYLFGKKILIQQEAVSVLLQDMLKKKHPCMVARFGANEMRVVSEYQKLNLGFIKELSDDGLKKLCEGAGFFPEDKELEKKFAQAMIDSCAELDLLGVWQVPMEEYTILRYAPSTNITRLENLEPWYLMNNPWTKALEGMKVVVVHPFAETIEAQYRKREKLFPNRELLPKFDLRTIKAVQTIAGQTDSRFNNWFDALEYMYREVMKEDFDVAILGCGAYGFPLAAKIKKAGKKAIHLGGATQLLFGIKGKRWDEMPYFQKLYNEAWVRPLKQETPQKANDVEGGCYW